MYRLSSNSTQLDSNTPIGSGNTLPQAHSSPTSTPASTASDYITYNMNEIGKRIDVSEPGIPLILEVLGIDATSDTWPWDLARMTNFDIGRLILPEYFDLLKDMFYTNIVLSIGSAIAELKRKYDTESMTKESFIQKVQEYYVSHLQTDSNDSTLAPSSSGQDIDDKVLQTTHDTLADTVRQETQLIADKNIIHIKPIETTKVALTSSRKEVATKYSLDVTVVDLALLLYVRHIIDKDASLNSVMKAYRSNEMINFHNINFNAEYEPESTIRRQAILGTHDSVEDYLRRNHNRQLDYVLLLEDVPVNEKKYLVNTFLALLDNIKLTE